MILQCKATLAFIGHKSVMLYIQPQHKLFINIGSQLISCSQQCYFHVGLKKAAIIKVRH